LTKHHHHSTTYAYCWLALFAAGAPPLKWDRKLYGAAAEWARKCRFQHSYNGNGENLGWNYGNWKQVVDAWYNEVGNLH
jgi:uncharacterized protein YkwD